MLSQIRGETVPAREKSRSVNLQKTAAVSRLFILNQNAQKMKTGCAVHRNYSQTELEQAETRCVPYNKGMKKVLLRLRSYYENEATQTEKKVLSYILKNPRQASVMDIRTLSANGSCSPSTLMRICQKNGFSGFRELRDSLLQEIGYRQTAASSLRNTGPLSHPRQLLMQEVYALEQTYELLDLPMMERVVSLLHRARAIHLYGIGASYLSMEDLQMKLVRISKPCVLLHDVHLQLVDASNTTSEDLAVIASYSGQTGEILQIAGRLKERECTIIAITQYSHNELSNLADYSLHVPCIEQGLRTGAATSRMTTLYLIDILYQMLLEKDYDQDMERIIETSQLLEKKQTGQNDLETDDSDAER